MRPLSNCLSGFVHLQQIVTMRNFVLIAILFFSISASAQILTEERTFTRQDTLRGSIGPERAWFDVTYYDLNLKLVPEKQYIEGYNEVTFTVLEKHPVMQLDLFEELEIGKVVYQGNNLEFEREGAAVFIEMPTTLEKDEEHKISVFYSGNPIVAKMAPWDGGFVFKKDANDKDWVGVACEGIGASLWWPNKDHPTDEPNKGMRFSCAVPNGLMFVAGGDLVETQEEGDYTRFFWELDYPINNYNVSLNVGDYAHIHDTWTNAEGVDLDLDYYVLKDNVEIAKKHFEQTKPMMACYEKYLGPYPFYEDGFALIETPYLGMEHQSGIAYGNEYKPGYAGNTAFTDGLEFDYIIIHEAGHEWWGNSVTAADMADLWIHESFCTYSEAIYVECLHGYDKAMSYINKSKAHVGNKEPVQGPYGVNMEGAGDMYGKGSLFLNTFRHIIADDELWWKIIYGLANDFKMQEIDASDVIEYVNEKSGRDMTAIWHQYLQHPAIPVLEVKTEKKRRNTIVSYRWVTDVENFEMPFQYRVGERGLWNTVEGKNEWSSFKLLKTKASDISFNDTQFYIDIQRVE